MTDFSITPMIAPPGSDDYLPCDEAHATRWLVTTPTEAGLLFEDHDAAERFLADARRADRFTWRDGDVEHH